MTNQQKVIKAIKLLITKRYSLNQTITCPLCPIFNARFVNCKGCPNSVFSNKHNITYGCTNRRTFKAWLNNDDPEPSLKFWSRALPRLKKLPSKAFTERGYKDEYFKFLIDIDNQIMKEYEC